MEVSMEMKKGPWNSDEDSKLIHSISLFGQGRWDSLSRFAGLKRSGKSCRLRWLNYLRPNLRQGKITPQEQLLILLLYFRFGNRWAKIAENLPGRSDNDVKNYWRTKVQKHAKELHCDVNSQQFRDFLLYQWLPSLTQQITPPVTSSSSSINTCHEIMTENSIICPNVVVSLTEPLIDDTDIWNNLAVYSSHDEDQYYYNNYWESAPSKILPNETMSLNDDMDLWLFP